MGAKRLYTQRSQTSDSGWLQRYHGGGGPQISTAVRKPSGDRVVFAAALGLRPREHGGTAAGVVLVNEDGAETCERW
ncbi:unnamed protein product [Boreogadus saida]